MIDPNNFSTFQGNLQQKPVTMPSAETLIISTLLSFITGTTTVNNIIPPLEGQHMLAIVPLDGNTLFGTGSPTNIAIAFNAAQGLAATLIYDPIGKKYWRVA